MKRYLTALIVITSLLLAGLAYNEYLGPIFRPASKIQLQDNIIQQNAITGNIVTGETIEAAQTFTGNGFSGTSLRKINETCGETIGTCEPGLKCMYPCGIQGCEYICLPEDERARP